MNIDEYSSELYENVSFQLAPLSTPESLAKVDATYNQLVSTRADGDARGPTYAFIYPNLMINRYSLWTGAFLVIPTGIASCDVLMDYWVHPSKEHDTQFIKDILWGEDLTQVEDIALCHMVQQGLCSPVYDVGRYAPEAEQPMFHFHQLLHRDLSSSA